MQAEVLVDGVETDAGWLQERGFQFGDGLFETVAIRQGKPCLWRAHLSRLGLGCRRLRLPLPDFPRLLEEASLLCAGAERAVLKIYWTAGRSERGYRRPAALHPQRIVCRSDWPEQPRVWHLRQCAHRLGENPGLAEIKHLNRLDQVVARAEWDDPSIGEGLMLGQDGRVVCGTMGNVFVQQGGQLHTPAVAAAGIAGVVRKLVIEAGERVAKDVRVGRVSVQDVRDADALYLANSLIGLVRIDRYESIDYRDDADAHQAVVEARRLCHQPETWDVHHE
jgi:4-amino-4-deoxychorismate lyase